MSRGLLHHVEIYVSDLKKSREFWDWFLEYMGYQVQEDFIEGISYRLGDTYLVLVQTLDQYKEPSYHRCRTGLNHLAFHAKSNEDVDQLKSKLIEKGVTLLYEDRFPKAGGPDSYGVFFEDPDRIKVEFCL